MVGIDANSVKDGDDGAVEGLVDSRSPFLDITCPLEKGVGCGTEMAAVVQDLVAMVGEDLVAVVAEELVDVAVDAAVLKQQPAADGQVAIPAHDQ